MLKIKTDYSIITLVSFFDQSKRNKQKGKGDKTMENQIIVTLPSRDLRAIAREALKGKWSEAFVTSIIFYLAISLPVSLIMAIFPPTSPAAGTSM